MSSKLERIALGLILCPITPLVGLLSGWWGAYALLPEKLIPLGMLSGLLLGILVNVLYLRRWINMAYQFDSKFWIAIYLFYSMGIFGFFMGVPVFNVALAIPAGFIVCGKLVSEMADKREVKRKTQLTAWFTTGILAAVCGASAFLALSDPYTSANLEGMFGLNFEFTRGMLIALITIGGAVLLAGNWWLTISTIWFSSQVLNRKPA